MEPSSSSSTLLGFSFLFVSLVCLGTWPALLRLNSVNNNTIQKFLGCPVHNRDSRFAYLDYALSYVISSSILLAFSLLQNSEDKNDFSTERDDAIDDDEQHHQTTTKTILIVCALLGGSLLSLGNMSMQWATTVFGAPLTTVVAIQASLTVILGTSLNFLLEPQKTAQPEFLVAGVIVFLSAIVLATRAHLLYGTNDEENQSQVVTTNGVSIDGIELGQNPKCSYGSLESEDSIESTSSIEQASESRGEDINLQELTPLGETSCSFGNISRRKVHSPKYALAVAVFGGCCFGFFSPAFNIAVNDPFGWSGRDRSPLTVPVANLWFSFAFTVASFVGNIPLMYRPLPQFALHRTTISEYMREAMSHRWLAILAGCLCGAANLLQFQGGRLVGFATADLVQAFPIVSTFWDIFLFGEYHSANRMVVLYLLAMYAMYGCGILFLMSSAAH